MQRTDPSVCTHDWYSIYWKVASLDGEGEKLNIEFCRSCGLIRLDPSTMDYLLEIYPVEEEP